MWSEDPGYAMQETRTKEPTEREQTAERASVAPPRWLFGFDGWRARIQENEFVLG